MKYDCRGNTELIERIKELEEVEKQLRDLKKENKRLIEILENKQPFNP